jgi:protein-disulfide isomerase
MKDRARPDPLLQPDKAIDHIQGPASAGVTLLEYGDFQCPSCAQAHAAMKIMLTHFGPKLRFVYRHYPQRQVHPDAELAAEAAEAAAAQGQFWPYYNLLFEHRQHLKEEHLLDYARRLELDIARYQNEMNDHVYLQRVQEHLQSGQQVGVRQTPAFYVNGVLVDVSFGLQRLHEAIEQALRAP